MQAKDIMTRDVITVAPDNAVRDVAGIMLTNRISAVPVVDTSGSLVGIVSEGDLMHRAEAGTRHRRSWWLSLLTGNDVLADEFVKEHSRKVADVMTRDVITASPQATLGDIAELLERNRIKRVPIVEKGKLVGIVSRANLLQSLIKQPVHVEGQDTNDAQIHQRILARLKAEPWSPTWLHVRVEHGVVELWGSAASQAQKKAARLAAELVPGVVRVDDNIVIESKTSF